MSTKYIGEKEIKNYQADDGVYEVEYTDGGKETLSRVMFDEIVSDEKCDATTLRDRRVRPVVAQVLAVMREWGVKTGEVGYFSALLNQSLMHNEEEALKFLWKGIIPTLQSLDDVDLVAVDKVLKSIPKEIPTPYLNGEDTPK